MRLTRRGWVLVAVVVVAFAMAMSFGARSLNAVVVPAFVALVAGAVQLRGLDPPRVRREPPPDGFPGETRTVRLEFETDDPFTGAVSDRLDRGLSASPSWQEGTVGAETFSYDVTYESRGEHEFGPVRLVARDVLGLVERELSVRERSTVLVYPRVSELRPAALGDLQALYQAERTEERDEFDRLREYERGDPLRDVHWKSSAKRDDLVVKAFAAESGASAVTVAAGAGAGEADAMADATASVALALLSVGVPVAVRTPDGTVETNAGGEHTVLEHLARVEGGRLPTNEADVLVEATARGVVVTLGGVEREFAELTAETGVADLGAAVEFDVDGTPTVTARTGEGERAGEDGDADERDAGPGRGEVAA
jgi:uncharacterized protein (DUF58 family)